MGWYHSKYYNKYYEPDPYTKCDKCKGNRDGYKLYWYKDSKGNKYLLCKSCLIEKLLEDKVIYDNIATNS